jgi:hypothetical protein
LFNLIKEENMNLKKSALGIVSFAMVLILIGCRNPASDGDNREEPGKDEVEDTITETTLKIKNESSYSLEYIKWQDTAFSSLSPGNSSTKEFSSSAELSGYIYFQKPLGRNQTNLSLYTQEIIIIPAGETSEFIFTDDTIVLDMEDQNNTGKLVSIDRVLKPPYVTWNRFTSDRSIIMRWDSVNYATGYTVYEKFPDSGSERVLHRFIHTQCSQMEFTLTGIPRGEEVYFTVRVSDDFNRWSDDSNLITEYFP